MMDNLDYKYVTGTNKLDWIDDAVSSGSYSIDIDDQSAANYKYDANGNTQKDVGAGHSFVVYDINNMPLAIYRSTGAVHKYYYDAAGQRVRKDASQTEYYISGAGNSGEVIVTSNGSNATYDILGLDKIGQTKRSGTTRTRYYYLKDHLGSIRVIVDTLQNIAAYDDYYPFGMQMQGRSSVVGSPDARFKYTEKERDSETGQDYFGVRYYNAKSSRWSSPDPVSSLHADITPYHYVRNNPLIFIDPQGLDTIYYGRNGIEQNRIPASGAHVIFVVDVGGAGYTLLMGDPAHWEAYMAAISHGSIFATNSHVDLFALRSDLAGWLADIACSGLSLGIYSTYRPKEAGKVSAHYDIPSRGVDVNIINGQDDLYKWSSPFTLSYNPGFPIAANELMNTALRTAPASASQVIGPNLFWNNGGQVLSGVDFAKGTSASTGAALWSLYFQHLNHVHLGVAP